MGTLLNDLRYGLRMLVKNPGFTAVAVLTLALGIGANTAIFSVVNAALLRPLPYRDSDRLLVLREKNLQQPAVSVAYPNYFDWKTQNQVFEQMASFQEEGFSLAGIDPPENVPGAIVSSNFLMTLGVRPLVGRDFVPAEDKLGALPTALISYELWQRRFGSSDAAIGSSLTLNGRPFTIAGVLPRRFTVNGPLHILVPAGPFMKDMTERGSHDDTVAIARLKPGVTMERAQADMDTIAHRLEQQYPASNSGYGVKIASLRSEFTGDIRPALLVLWCAVGFVLLIACANVANLLLARAAGREKEMAIRAALGAGRLRVIRQILTESALLAVIGGALGLLLGAWAISGLTALIPRGQLAGLEVSIDPRVLGFTALVVLGTALASGLAPAFQAGLSDLNATLKEGGRGSAESAGRARLRNALVVSEIALALVLLAGAGLLARSLRQLLKVDPGFNPQKVLSLEVSLTDQQYPKPDQVGAFSTEVLRRIQTLPGVATAAVTTNLPLADSHDRGDITIEGQPLPGLGHFPHPDFHSISADYFRVMGIPILRGRSFTESDNQNAPGVVLVSEGLARRYWPAGNAVGKRLLEGDPSDKHKDDWLNVVGVVGDTKQYGLDKETRLEVYRPYLQEPPRDINFVIRSSADPAILTAAAKKEIWAVDKGEPVDAVTLQQVFNDSVGPERSTTLLLGAFAALALLLSGIGIYGVISYSVIQRTHEIGVRMALGAKRGDVMKMVVRHGAILTAIGVAAGLVMAMAVTRLLTRLLFHVRPADPLTYAGVSLILAAVAFAASYIPARRATKVDPMEALRYE